MVTDGNGTNRTNAGVTLDQTNKDLIINFNNRMYSKVEGVGALEKDNYTIFFKKVDITNLIQKGRVDSLVAPLTIELTSYSGGTPVKPVPVNTNKFTISWSCKNAPGNVQYKIKLSPINIPSEKTQVFTTANYSYNFQNLSDGKWKITIFSNNSDFEATSANTTIEVRTKGSSFALWLLLFVALSVGGYFYWKKLQEDKLKKLNSSSGRDSFTSSTTNNSNTDKTGYF
jgi:hypothetical protein